MATTWTPIASVVQTTIPNDLTGNSLSLAPVSGDATAVALKLGNGSTTLFNVDATGSLTAAAATVSGALAVSGNTTLQGTLRVNGATTLASSTVTGNESVGGTLTTATLNVTGNETIGGTETVTGLLTANGNITTPLIKTTQGPTSQTINSTSYSVSNVQLPGSFGDGNNYPLSGISSDSLGNLSVNYQGVAAIKMANPGYNSTNGTTPGTAFPTTFQSGAYNFNAAGNTLFSLSATSAKFGFTSNTVPVVMQALSGNILQLQNSGSSPSFTPQVVGTVDTNGNLVLSGNASAVNGVFSGTLKASGATTLAGTSVTSLSNSGNETIAGTLNVTGNTTLGALTTSGVTNTGTSTAAAFTISTAGGRFTFGDGTFITTAPASAGSASQFVATTNGTTSAPAYTYTNNTDTGSYLKTASATAAVLGLSVNATDAMTLTKTGVSVPGTLSVTGTSTGNVLQSSAAGSATSPTISNTTYPTTGLYFSATPAVVVTAAGTAVASFSAASLNVAQALNAQAAITVTGAATLNGSATFAGPTTLNGAVSASATITSTTPNGTASFVSSQGFRHEIRLGHVAVTSTTANQTQQCTEPTSVVNGTSVITRAYSHTIAKACSVLSIILDNLQSMPSAMTVQLNKNGSTISGATATLASNSASVIANFPKGQIGLLPGDNIYANITFASATSGQNACIFVKVHLEMGA